MNIYQCRYLILIFFCCFSLSANARLLDTFKLQYAGEIGLLSYGVGHEFSDWYDLEFFYGVVPESEGGEKIDTYAVKNIFTFYESEYLNKAFKFYHAFQFYHVIGVEYQSSRNSSYPLDYYRLGSVRMLLSLGTQMSIKKVKGEEYGGYFESGVNDIVLINWINNQDSIAIKDYVSLAVGFYYIL